MRRVATLTALLVVVGIGDAYALRDHQHCYRITDPLGIRGVVDVASALEVEAGCRLGAAKLFCDPAEATVLSSNVPVGSVSGRGLLDGRICYRLRCRRPHPADQSVTDEFGTHPFTRLRPRLLCTPAVVGPPMTLLDNLDHVTCYRAVEDQRLEGVVDVDTLHFGTANSCTLGRSKLLCVASSVTVQQVNVPVELPLVGTGEDDRRVCYGLRCNRPHPGPQVVSDRFGSRTATGLAPKLLCAPAPVSSTTTTSTSTTSTLNTLPPPSDPPLACQRAIEAGGMAYAREMLDQITLCTAPGGGTITGGCLSSPAVLSALAAKRTAWAAGAATPCAGVDLRGVLGYSEVCGVNEGMSTFPTTALNAAGDNNDLLDCLALGTRLQLQTSANAIYAGQDATEPCRTALADGAMTVLRTNLEAVNACVQQPTTTSVAACWAADFTSWRAAAATQCAGVTPASLGYSTFCSGYPQATPNSYAPHAFPCSFNVSGFDRPLVDNDVFDCATCEAGEGILGVARELFGANICCIGGTCNQVLTRFACRRDGGFPARYRMTTLTATDGGNAHGIATGADGSLYLSKFSGITKVTPGGVVSTVTSAVPFLRGLAVDAAGNLYGSTGCSHRILKVTPAGVVTTIAGTGVGGSTGDGGPATAAQIIMPDGVAVDPAGNVYFTESGILAFFCGGVGIPSERVRMIDTSGMIHTVAGSVAGGGGEGGPATLATMLIPYGLAMTPGGSLFIGEAGGQRVLRVQGGTLTRIAGVFTSPASSHSGYGGPASNARFYENCGVAVDPDGNVLLAIMEDNRVALLDSLGSVINIGGTGEGPGGAVGQPDGSPATLVRLNTPEDVAIAPDGTIYVSDLGLSTIRILRREPF